MNDKQKTKAMLRAVLVALVTFAGCMAVFWAFGMV